MTTTTTPAARPDTDTPPAGTCLADTDTAPDEVCLYALDGGRCLDPTAPDTGAGFHCPGCAAWVCAEDAAVRHEADCFDYFRWVTQ